MKVLIVGFSAFEQFSPTYHLYRMQPQRCSCCWRCPHDADQNRCLPSPSLRLLALQSLGYHSHGSRHLLWSIWPCRYQNRNKVIYIFMQMSWMCNPQLMPAVPISQSSGFRRPLVCNKVYLLCRSV